MVSSLIDFVSQPILSTSCSFALLGTVRHASNRPTRCSAWLLSPQAYKRFRCVVHESTSGTLRHGRMICESRLHAVWRVTARRFACRFASACASKRCHARARVPVCVRETMHELAREGSSAHPCLTLRVRLRPSVCPQRRESIEHVVHLEREHVVHAVFSAMREVVKHADHRRRCVQA
eukprot:6203199-Pleurochrysis_carterae.AAC.3